jgi:lysophospholipase
MKHLLLSSVLLILAPLVQAIPEQGFRETWLSEVLPYFEQHFQKAELVTARGSRLAYRTFYRGPGRRNLIIVPGRTEPMPKYAEIVYDLRDLDLNIFLVDLSNQGESERPLPDPHKGHVRSFAQYDSDFDQWIESHVLPLTHGKDLYLLAHSLGGFVASRFLARNSGLIKRAVFSAPMYKIHTDPYSESTARLLARLLLITGKGTQYAPDRGPYVPEEDVLEKSDVTRSEGRHWANKYLYTTFPELALGGPTVRWVHETLKATSRNGPMARRITTPLLILQAGDDKVVKNPAQVEVCRLARDCRIHTYPGAYHEVLQEQDHVRSDALARALGFLFN